MARRSNSPYLFTHDRTAEKLRGQQVIIATNNGTAGMCLALDRQANAVHTASLRNLSAAADFLQRRHAQFPEENLLILASGERQLGQRPRVRDEDYVFSLFLRQVLLGKTPKTEAERIRRHVAEVLRTEYTPLNQAAHLSEERIEGDISEVLRIDMCPVVPQCLPVEGKPYVRIVSASISGVR